MALRAVPDHPKFADLMAKLGRPKCVALGCLEAVWHFTGRFTPQGNIGKYSDDAIETWVGWDGSPGALIDALTHARWLDPNPEHRLIVHDWHIHADNATKTALRRSHLRFVVSTVLQQCGDNDAETFNDVSNQWRPPEPEPVPEPEPEPVKTETGAAASASHKVPRPEPAIWDGEPLTLETLRGERWPVPAASCAEWGDAFPGVNVLAELLKMRAWLQANPRNRKTAGGMMRFILNWLTRAQNSSRPAGGGNGYNGNRGQARTDGNIEAAKRAAANIAGQNTDGPRGSAAGFGEQRNAGVVRQVPL